jgi:hypothetical protein
MQDKDTFSVQEIAKLPTNAPYFMILVNNAFTYDDGYGTRGESSTSTHRSLNIEICLTEEALNSWVIENDRTRYGPPKVYSVVRVNPVQVVRSVAFQFKDL